MKTLTAIYESILKYTHFVIESDWIDIIKKAIPKGVKILSKDQVDYVVDPNDKTKVVMKYYYESEELVTDLTKVELRRILAGRVKEIKF